MIGFAWKWSVHRLNQQSAIDFVIIASLLLGRLGFLLSSPWGLSGDAFGYVGVAQTVIETGKLPALGAQPLGYPILIAPLLASGLGVSLAVLVMNSLMDCLLVALLLWTARSVLPDPGDRAPRLFCWLLAAIQPFTAEMASSVYTETPTMFLVFVGVWLLFIPSNATSRVVGFAFLGAASLLRTDVLALNIGASIIYLTLFTRKAFDKRLASLGFVVLCLFPIFMLAYQYHSTHELGLVRLQFRQPGYYAWMRKWFALEKIEYDRFAFDVGTPNWAGFNVANYPSRTFDSAAERNRVAELLATWRTAGYVDSVDRGFQQLGLEKLQQHPLRSLVFVPLLRMIHYWINIDGAEAYFRVVPLGRPISTLVVACTAILRLVLIFLAAIGAYAVWLRPPTPDSDQVLWARFASLFVLLRTLELGALGTVAWGGLMEVRYILVAFPFVILLSFWGVRYLCRRRITSKPLNQDRGQLEEIRRARMLSRLS